MERLLVRRSRPLCHQPRCSTSAPNHKLVPRVPHDHPDTGKSISLHRDRSLGFWVYIDLMAEPDPTPLRLVEHVEVYEQIRDEQLRELEGQRGELDSMRARISQYLAFVGAATGFLAGTGLTSVPAANRDLGFYLLAALGTAGFAALTYFAVMVLVGSGGAPRAGQFAFHLDSPKLLTKAETQGKHPSKSGFTRYLANAYGIMVRDNEPLMRGVRRSYVIALSLGGFTLMSWCVLLWLKA